MAVETSPVRILIVDDHPHTATMLARVLENLDTPVEILTACGGEEALQAIGDGVVDILITDFVMRGMSGIDLIEKLKEREPAHIILITAYDTTALTFTARRLGVQDYLTKPVQPEKIRDIVANVVHKLRPAPAAPAAPAPAVVNASQPKILVADDNPDNIRLLTVRLQSEGYTSAVARDGEETLAKIRAELPDLVLLDVNMPKKDGFQVLAEMRASADISHIPVIIVTAARILRQDIREGLLIGADDYITKPFDWREVTARIRAKLRVKQAEDALRQRNRELEMVPELGLDLSAQHDLQAIAKVLLSRTAVALDAAHAALIVFNPNGSVWHFAYPDAPAEAGAPANEGLVGHVVVSRRGAIVANAASDDRWTKTPGETVGAAIAVPLLGHRVVMGVLTLTHPQPEHFVPAQLSLLQATATQAAIAVENAQLLHSEQKRVQELVGLNLLSHRLAQTPQPENWLEQLPDEMVRALGFPLAAIWRAVDDRVTLCSLAGDRQLAERESIVNLVPQQAYITHQAAQTSGAVDERSQPRETHGNPPVQSALAVPLFRRGQIWGVLSIHSARPNAFQESDRLILEILAHQIGGALD